MKQARRRTPRRDVGIDGKIAIGPALNLDVTVNPDYSQVDVDQQVTNLDRYELFFPGETPVLPRKR